MELPGVETDGGGKVVAFPFAYRTAAVRRAADAVAERHGHAANVYWREMIAGVRAEMMAAGVREEAIDGELRAFSASVFEQIGQRHG
jgi:hypothetical protein